MKRWTGVLLFLAGCAPAHMATVGELRSVTPLEVRGRNGFTWGETFSFGNWVADRVRRGWGATSSWNVFGVGGTSKTEKFEFRVGRAGGPALWGQAAVGVTQKEVNSFLFGQSVQLRSDEGATLAVSIRQEGDERADSAARLLMHGTSAALLSGDLFISGREPVSVRASNALEGTSITMSSATGYLFSRSGRTIGAVEVLNGGRIWIDPALDGADQDALAASAAALLLHRPGS
jgi:hypothetical protein